MLEALYAVVNIILSPLPVGNTLNLTTDALAITTSPYWPQLGWINNYIPIDQAVAAFTTIIGAWTVIYLIRIGLWLWNLLPWGGSN